MRTERQTPPLPGGVVDNPGAPPATRYHLEATAIRDQPLVFLDQGDGFAQRGGALHGETDRINTGRPHPPGANFQTKPGIPRALLRGVPETGNEVDGPSFERQGPAGRPAVSSNRFSGTPRFLAASITVLTQPMDTVASNVNYYGL